MKILALVYGATGLLLLIHGLHRLVMLQRLIRPEPTVEPPLLFAWPHVTVQLPVYNESTVLKRLLQAVLSLDYPKDRLQIQLLDDSTDETAPLAEDLVRQFSALGYSIERLHRSIRKGYKAGALRAGLASATGEFIAIFDADFLPAPDFLRRMIPYFNEAKVGMVQARWGHLNGGQNFLTRMQQVFIDGHFLIEQMGRARSGHLFNFNGSAGIWRRSVIEEAGNWQADTLTEDLDLSYRAQLQGWRFLYRPEVVVAGELPSSWLAYKSQQHRWSKGTMQTALKLGGRIAASSLSLPQKVESCLHLFANSIHLAVVILGLLNLPIFYLELAGKTALPLFMPHMFTAMMLFTLCFAGTSIWLGRDRAGWRALALPGFIAVSIGLSVHHAAAWLEGLGRQTGEFVRTPKISTAASTESSNGAGSRTWTLMSVELILAMIYGFTLCVALHQGVWAWVLTLLLHFIGFGYVGLQTLGEIVWGHRVSRGVDHDLILSKESRPLIATLGDRRSLPAAR